MDRSRRQRTALQINPPRAAGQETSGAAVGGEGEPGHLVVRLQPRSRRNAVVGEREGAVLIALQAPPVEGAANAALLRFLAEQLGLPRGAVRLVHGTRARLKWIALDGLPVAEARSRLLQSP